MPAPPELPRPARLPLHVSASLTHTQSTHAYTLLQSGGFVMDDFSVTRMAKRLTDVGGGAAMPLLPLLAPLLIPLPLLKPAPATRSCALTFLAP